MTGAFDSTGMPLSSTRPSLRTATAPRTVQESKAAGLCLSVQIFFYPLVGGAAPDPALLAYIQSNGGRNNIVTVAMHWRRCRAHMWHTPAAMLLQLCTL